MGPLHLRLLGDVAATPMVCECSLLLCHTGPRIAFALCISTPGPAACQRAGAWPESGVGLSRYGGPTTLVKPGCQSIAGKNQLRVYIVGGGIVSWTSISQPSVHSRCGCPSSSALAPSISSACKIEYPITPLSLEELPEVLSFVRLPAERQSQPEHRHTWPPTASTTPCPFASPLGWRLASVPSTTLRHDSSRQSSSWFLPTFPMFKPTFPYQTDWSQATYHPRREPW